MLSKSKQVEFSMGSDTENVINTLLIHFYKIFNAYKKLFLIPDSVEWLEYELHKIDIIRAESYIVSPDWIASKKAKINPKNE